MKYVETLPRIFKQQSIIKDFNFILVKSVLVKYDAQIKIYCFFFNIFSDTLKTETRYLCVCVF